MSEKKVISIEDLEKVVQLHKTNGKKVVMCHGCFDLVHFGHILHFEEAKQQGDILFVTVTPDEYIQKGPDRPFFHQDIRLRQLAAQESIDYVALNKWPTAVETIRLLKPDVYVKGEEVLNNKEVDVVQTRNRKASNLSLEEETVKSLGGRVYYTRQPSFSSSSIINRITSAIPEESKEFLSGLRKKYKAEDFLNQLKQLEDVRVLLIGDSIFDEYIYCKAMEKSGKEALISYKLMDSETHLGGVFTVANQLSKFTKNLSLITCTGEEDTPKEYSLINNSLNPRIEKHIFSEIGKKTIKKTRFVDDYKGNKIFQHYNSDEIEISPENEERILDCLETRIKDFDLVLISDYGHGLITQRIIDYLSESEKFLAINCQLNGGNLGYNFITKYKKANFISLNERELRLPFQEKKSEINVPIKRLANQLSAEKIIVTSGKYGSTYYDKGNFFYSPSLVKEPLDTIGAGDSVFSLTSLLAYKDFEPELIPFFGNSIGGLSVRIMGNRRSVDQVELNKFISYLLK